MNIVFPVEGQPIEAHLDYIDNYCGFYDIEETKSLEICTEIGINNEGLLSCSSKSVVIKADNMSISGSKNDEIRVIDLSKNRKVEFLPIHVFVKLPLITNYYANKCSIRNISRKNFERLHAIYELNFKDNSIETIPSDTFQDQDRLIYLNLGNVYYISRLRKLHNL